MKKHPLKIVRIEVEDILFDPDTESDMLTKACFRTGIVRRITGICDSGDRTVVLPLETVENDVKVPLSYRFAPLPDASFEGIAAELQVRHMHGLTLIGTFRVDDQTIWGFYARYPQKA